MKKSKFGKILVLSSLSVITLFSCNNDKDKGKGTDGNYVIYQENDYGTASKVATIDIKFYNSDIPYVDVNKYLALFNNYYDISNNGNVFTFVNNRWKNDSHNYSCNATFDVTAGTLTYDDFAVFTNTDYSAANPIDVNSSLGGLQIGEGEGSYIYYPFHVEETYYYHDPNDKTVVNLKSTYSINSYVDNNRLFLPLYTTKALFNPYGQYQGLFFNGKALYLEGDIGEEESNYDKIIKNGIFTPSSTYLEYCFNELCLELDLLYGLKGTTRNSRSTGKTISYNFGLNNGDSLAKKTLSSYKTQFTKSPTECDKATYAIYKNLLDDGGHTVLIRNSYYSTYKNLPLDAVGDDYLWTNNSYWNIAKAAERTSQESSYDATMYSSSKNTAVLTLNGFTDLNKDFSAIIDCWESLNKTTGKDRNKIKHLIVDLGINGGGYVFLQYMLTYFLTGDNTNFGSFITNATNTSKGYVKLTPDFNISESPKYEKNENIINDGISIDIICSNATFSAANATACLTQKYATNTVMIDGEVSGGGACSVMPSMVSPLGQYAQWSSPNRLCLDNTSYEHDDAGVDVSSGKIRSDCQWNSHKQLDYLKFSDYSLIIDEFDS